MPRRICAVAVYALLALTAFAAAQSPAPPNAPSTLTPVWIEIAPDGAVLARVVVDSPTSCPVLQIDGQPAPMKFRDGLPANFKPACELAIPADAFAVQWNGRELPLPRTPQRAIIIGDTGCRVKGSSIQACNDPQAWPFRAVAAQVASGRPDLILHVGDYLYRESPCPDPAKGCQGPWGDNWDTWNADFFDAAAPALSAAPWIFVRGNHESCKRAWKGWFYYLYPGPMPAACNDSPAYIAQSGRLHVAVLDTGSIIDGSKDPAQVQRSAAALSAISGHALWTTQHHPFWVLNPGPNSGLTVTPQDLAPAFANAQPQGVQLVLVGHVHLFEFLPAASGRPNELIAGDSGTQLDVADSGSAIHTGTLDHDFGFTQLDRQPGLWWLTLKNSVGTPLVACVLPDSGAASCQSVSTAK